LRSSASTVKYSSAKTPTSKSEERIKWVSSKKWPTKKWMKAKMNTTATNKNVSLCSRRCYNGKCKTSLLESNSRMRNQTQTSSSRLLSLMTQMINRFEHNLGAHDQGFWGFGVLGFWGSINRNNPSLRSV